MVNPGLLLSGASFLMTLRERQRREEAQKKLSEDIDSHDHASGEGDVEIPPDMKRQKEMADGMRRLVDIEERSKPSPEDKDAFSSVVVELQVGETAVVTVEPAQGFNLMVKRIHFDRRDNHDYKLNVGGDITSVSHRAKYTKPKRVTQSDRVVAEVTNNSSSKTVLDFELEAWAEQPGSGGI